MEKATPAESGFTFSAKTGLPPNKQPTVLPVSSPPRRGRLLARPKLVAGVFAAGLLVLLALNIRPRTGYPLFLFSGCHHHVAGKGNRREFPRPDDPFRFLPCTNATLPPALDDPDASSTWAGLFDPDPEDWSWGNDTTPEKPRASRGLYVCGYLDVPLDYTNASEPRIVRLAVTKFQVSGRAGPKSERTLVVEPGGPGGSGTGLVWRAAEEITARLSGGTMDVLGWDPRGVNTTLPAIACYPHNAARDRWLLLTGQFRETSGRGCAESRRVQLELADAMNAAVMSACWERHGDLGRFMGTAIVARDLDRLREALGEDELSGYLISYGTGIGQTYGAMFPDRVGRMVLDGTEYVRDHRLLGGFGWTSLDNVTDAWRDGFLGECLHAGPEHCALARPARSADSNSDDGSISGSITLDALRRRMEGLVSSLIAQPRPGYTSGSGPSLVTYSALVSAIYGSLYNAESWPALAQMLWELEAGNTTLAAAFLERSAWEYDPTLPVVTNQPPKPSTDELTPLVICADSYDAPQPPFSGSSSAAVDDDADPLAWWESLWANMTAASWISGSPRFFTVLPCRHFGTYWPEPAEVYRGDLNHTLRNPVLLIAETYDPATPLRNGRRLAAEMGVRNARLVAHHGYGHSSRDRSNCTDGIAREFILTGRLPEAAETACYANERPYLYGKKGSSDGLEGEVVSSSPGGGGGSAVPDPLEAWRRHQEYLATWNPGLLPRF